MWLIAHVVHTVYSQLDDMYLWMCWGDRHFVAFFTAHNQSGCPCSDSCPRDPALDKRKKMDGWTTNETVMSADVETVKALFFKTHTNDYSVYRPHKATRATLKKRIWDFKNVVGKENTAYIPVTDHFYEKLIIWIAEQKSEVTSQITPNTTQNTVWG